MTETASTRGPRLPLLARLWREHLSARRPLVAAAIVCALTAAVCTAGLAKQLEPAINDVLVARDPRLLWLVPLGFAATALVRTLAQLGQSWSVNRLGHGMVGDIQVRLFGALVRADLAPLALAATAIG